MDNVVEKLSKKGKAREQDFQQSGKTKTGSVQRRHSGLEGPSLEGSQSDKPDSLSCLFFKAFANDSEVTEAQRNEAKATVKKL